MKILPVGAALFHVYGRTEAYRHSEANSRFFGIW